MTKLLDHTTAPCHDVLSWTCFWVSMSNAAQKNVLSCQSRGLVVTAHALHTSSQGSFD